MPPSTVCCCGGAWCWQNGAPVTGVNVPLLIDDTDDEGFESCIAVGVVDWNLDGSYVALRKSRRW
jgi:hypothetical protein